LLVPLFLFLFFGACCQKGENRGGYILFITMDVVLEDLHVLSVSCEA
jgi:hypothetical protein